MPTFVLALLPVAPPDPLPGRLLFPLLASRTTPPGPTTPITPTARRCSGTSPRTRPRGAALGRELLHVWEDLAVAQDDDGEEGDDRPERR